VYVAETVTTSTSLTAYLHASTTVIGGESNYGCAKSANIYGRTLYSKIGVRRMSKKNEIDMLDTFVFTSDKVHADLYSVIVDLDLIIRRHSGPPHEKSIEHLMNNKEAFEKDALRLIWSIVHANLDVDTIDDESPQKGQRGLFPSAKGEPDITHLMWQLKNYNKKTEKKFAEY